MWVRALALTFLGATGHPRGRSGIGPVALFAYNQRLMSDTVTIPALHRMKSEGRKITGVVAYDYQMAQIVDRAGVEIVSVGDSVGINFWGHRSELDVTLDEMILVCAAVRRGVKRALVSCDFPFGPLQEGPDSAIHAAIRIVKEG